ncbi:hypothetical protein ABE387_05295 [Bacillus licheniformis]|uniref:hypothetical protein n=1 Tax=Bacillus licheniformis TaxID=1402 RepID=UPI002DBBE030|nr:hypothetical protein [Bacillus licheniformis]MEC1863168.1 hypothetical protein [Bacillus licheniformis]
MLEPRFCYRILAAAGLAHDEQGNDTDCFAQIDHVGGCKITQGQYDRMHEQLKHRLADQYEIDVNHLECISQEEYDDNVDDY